jgi:hypothetical protein
MENSTPLSPILYAKVLGSGRGGNPNAVLYTAQTLSAEQQAQARANIGATDAETSIPDNVKAALLNCFNHVAWTDEHGQDYVDALQDALYPLDHITAVYTQSGTVYDTDSLDSLKADLVVTAYYQSGDSKTVTDYTLSGTLTEGTSTITVSYAGKTATFDVAVTSTQVGTIVKGFTNGVITNDVIRLKANNARTVAIGTSGTNAVKLEDGSASAYYPIPIRSGATQIRLEHTDSNVLTWALCIYKWSDQYNDWYRYVGTEWQKNLVYDISAYNDGSCFLGMNIGVYDPNKTGENPKSDSMMGLDTSSWKVYME